MGDKMEEAGDSIHEELSSLELSAAEAEGRNVSDLQQRCKTILEELEQFEILMNKKKKDSPVELRRFRGGLLSELKSLQKLSDADPQAEKTLHTLRSSNFPFYDAVWSTAKNCSGVIAFKKRFYWSTQKIQGSTNTAPRGRQDKHHSAVVDVVSKDGLEWTKVSTITEKRIIYDLAKAGWVEDSSEDEDEEYSRPGDDDDDDEPEGLLRQAEALVKASKSTRIRYKHPTVRLMLPRIELPVQKEVASVIEQVKSLGVIVHTKEDIEQPPSITEFLRRLKAEDDFQDFSDILNVDCTILLAFVSDLSHGQVQKEDWHNKAISKQIEIEQKEKLLPSSLWPACGSRKLVCSRNAAARMHEIVDLIGTETEKKRAAFLMEDSEETKLLTNAQRIQAFQELSEYDVPKHWGIPIEIEDIDIESLMSSLPPVAEKVAQILSPINKSVFLYGWASRRTTISSNRTAAKDIETTIEINRTDDEEMGPDIWLCPTVRSLVGKEKQRRGQ
ncbi:hypothetical protein F5884DRAFT_523793 [Xylogone sp. PMI_703]|nr:hypothetical protein F5884DRAFT_523793 [Xylogone sp. PMI_703]